MEKNEGVCTPEVQDKKVHEKSTPANGSEKNEDSDCLDISEPGLIKELAGFYSLTKHGKRAVCPFRPERTRQEIDAKTHHVVKAETITPTCSSFCPHFRASRSKEGYALSITCTNEVIVYEIPRDKFITATPSKAAEQGTKDGRMGILK